MRQRQIHELKIGQLVARVPIIQGGMGVGISGVNLASAVANAGGIGVISAVGLGMMEPDFKNNFKEANKRALIKEIQKARKRTTGLIGVNIMVALSDYDDLVDGAIEAKADALFLGAGLPLKFSSNITTEVLKNMHTRIVPIVSSAKAVQVIFNFWSKKYNHVPDAVVVEGPKAGGHLGFKYEQITNPDYALEKLIPQVAEAVGPFAEMFQKEIPVIAAGGIFTGQDMHNIMELGADGVQLGTRFIATHECDASPEFKQAFIDAKEEDLMLIQSPVGLPGRALRNRFLDEVTAGKKMPFSCPWKCLRTCDYKQAPYCIAKALTQAKMGHLENGFVFSGVNGYRIREIVSVQDIINELIDEYAVVARKKSECIV